MSGHVVLLYTGEIENAREAAILNDIGRHARTLGMQLSRGTDDVTEWHMRSIADADTLRAYAKKRGMPKWWRLS
jgi:hypothetical protein